MKKLLLIILTTLCCSALAETLSEQELAKLPAIDKYKTQTEYQYLKCNAEFFIELQKAELGESVSAERGYKKCVDDAKTPSKKLLKMSLQKIKTPAASTSLKNYHVKFLAALEGIKPGKNEIAIDYNRRQQALGDSMKEAWLKFELEQ